MRFCASLLPKLLIRFLDHWHGQPTGATSCSAKLSNANVKSGEYLPLVDGQSRLAYRCKMKVYIFCERAQTAVGSHSSSAIATCVRKRFGQWRTSSQTSDDAGPGIKDRTLVRPYMFAENSRSRRANRFGRSACARSVPRVSELVLTGYTEIETAGHGHQYARTTWLIGAVM